MSELGRNLRGCGCGLLSLAVIALVIGSFLAPRQPATPTVAQAATATLPADRTLDVNYRQLGSADIYTLVLPRNAAPAAITADARAFCAPHNWCEVFGWIDPRKVAKTMPMSISATAANVFVYRKNSASGLDDVSFYCPFIAPGKPKCSAQFTAEELRNSD